MPACPLLLYRSQLVFVLLWCAIYGSRAVLAICALLFSAMQESREVAQESAELLCAPDRVKTLKEALRLQQIRGLHWYGAVVTS